MSQFTVDTIEALEFDFTKIKHNVQPARAKEVKYCSGKGVIPEPTEKQLEGYSAGVKAIFGLDQADDDAETKKQVEGEIVKANESVTKKLMGLTSALCQGSPSSAELEELPPRYRNAFLKWVYAEVTNPEVSSGATSD